MDDKTSLLNQLHINRDDEPVSDGGHGKWIAIGIAIVALIAFSVYWLSRPSGIPISVTVAREVAGAASTRGASTLDASGYIVARRQSFLS